MNSLSWTIYFIQIINSFDTFLGWLTAFFFITALLAFFAPFAFKDEIVDHQKFLSRYWKFGIFSGFFFAFIGVMVPDRNTMLLIAASQIGERVMTSHTVQSVTDPSVDLLRTWIEDQTRTIRERNRRS